MKGKALRMSMVCLSIFAGCVLGLSQSHLHAAASALCEPDPTGTDGGVAVANGTDGSCTFTDSKAGGATYVGTGTATVYSGSACSGTPVVVLDSSNPTYPSLLAGTYTVCFSSTAEGAYGQG